MKALETILLIIALAHANPDDSTMEEWEPVFDAADDIHRMLAEKMEVRDE